MGWSSLTGVIVVAIKSIGAIKELADISSHRILKNKGSTRMSEGIVAKIKDKVVQDAQLLSLFNPGFEFSLGDDIFQLGCDERILLFSLPSEPSLQSDGYQEHSE